MVPTLVGWESGEGGGHGPEDLRGTFHNGDFMLAGALGIKFVEEERGPGWGWTWERHSGNLEEGWA